MNCSHCGKLIKDEDSIFCPYCSKPLNQQIMRTGKPIAAGILVIISACLSIIIGILSFLILTSYNSRYYDNGFSLVLLITGMWAVFSFGFGLASGILSLKRIHFVISILGSCFLIISGVLTCITMLYGGTILLLIAIPMLILTILGTIFIAISKKEFT